MKNHTAAQHDLEISEIMDLGLPFLVEKTLSSKPEFLFTPLL